MKPEITAKALLDFWFSEPMNKHWFSSTSEIDQEITSKYETIWEQASAGKLDHWKGSAEGCLALCIILDQLPLNMFRNTPKSFSTEQQAVEISKHAIAQGLDNEIGDEQISFLYMPLMHSENLDDQDLSVKKFAERGLENNLRFAEHHRSLVKKYGRFPHRNKILGRKSSQAEVEYLKSDKAFTG